MWMLLALAAVRVNSISISRFGDQPLGLKPANIATFSAFGLAAAAVAIISLASVYGKHAGLSVSVP
jgi:hypothetical protein